MAQQSGYITPGVDTDSGSEWVPSDSEPQTKPKQRTRRKVPSAPSPAPSTVPCLEQQVPQIKQKTPAPALPSLAKFPPPVDQMSTFNCSQQLQLNAFKHHDFHSLNNINAGSQCLPPSAFQKLPASNVGGFGMDITGHQLGGLQDPGLWSADTQGEQGTNAEGPMDMDMDMDINSTNWTNPPPLGGYGDPVLDKFAAQVAAFEFDFDLDLNGISKTIALPDSAPGIKLEPAMDNPFALTRDQESTATTERSDPKAKITSNTNANATNIPLLCLLCEKTPRFSDVSHLLTHISSKGHLSRRFHLNIKAQADDEIQQRIHQFEVWFAKNDINRLLTIRQEAKDQKKESQTKRQRGAGKNKKSRHNSSSTETFKVESDGTPHMATSHLNPLNQQSWNPDLSYDNTYLTPSHKRTQSEYPEPDSPQLPAVQNDEPIETVKQAGSKTPTLKGVTFVGMGIFDAGTPEMKRMRNQKKDPSVVANMALVSQSISDTEIVWGREMENIERIRSVYDTPSDPSDEIGPDEDDEPSPIRKPRAPRVAPKLKPRSKAKPKPKSEVSPKPTGPTTLRLTRSAARATNRGPTQAARGGKQGGGTRGGSKAPKFEADWPSDDEMEIPQRRRGLSVFQDNAPNDGSLGGSMLGARLQGTQGLDGNPFGGQQSSLSHRSAMQGLPSNRPLSSMYGRQDNQNFSLVDKENDRNAFPMQQNTNTNMQSGFYQPCQNMQSGGGYNPLCLQRPDSFNQVYSTGFDTSKPSNSPFQAMNGMGYNDMHAGLNGLSGSLGLSNDLSNGMTNGMNNTVSMTNGIANGLHSGTNNILSHGLNSATNNGSQYQLGNNSGQNNGFDVQ